MSFLKNNNIVNPQSSMPEYTANDISNTDFQINFLYPLKY